jgi:hypothetical protein
MKGVNMYNITIEVNEVIYFTGLYWYQITVNGTVAAERSSERDAWRKAGEIATRLKGELQLELKKAA